MRAIRQILPIAQHHESQQKGVANETNHFSLGTPLMDMDVQERSCSRKRQHTDITLYYGGDRKENERIMDAVPITTGSDEGCSATTLQKQGNSRKYET
jgi:hypothetical protein